MKNNILTKEELDDMTLDEIQDNMKLLKEAEQEYLEAELDKMKVYRDLALRGGYVLSLQFEGEELDNVIILSKDGDMVANCHSLLEATNCLVEWVAGENVRND